MASTKALPTTTASGGEGFNGTPRSSRTSALPQRLEAARLPLLGNRNAARRDDKRHALIRAVTSRPLLRKDFLWTPYQIAQSAAHGADGILLIVGRLTDTALRECMEEARRYALDALVEVHTAAELRRAIAAGADLIGINNRDLRTLVTDLHVGQRVLPMVPESIFTVSESGVRSAGDVAGLRFAGANGFLIGEALMRAEDPKALIEEFIGVAPIR